MHCDVTFIYSGADAAGAEGLKKHAFFASIDWVKLYQREVQPPFKPVMHRSDTFYFDQQFTTRPVFGRLLVVSVYLLWNTYVLRPSYEVDCLL